MIRIGIAVEDSTEVEFVNRSLLPDLLPSGISVTPVSIDGNVTIQRLAREMANLYWSFDAVSSLVDFYGFQGKNADTVNDLECHIRNNVEKYIGDSVTETKLIPYVQIHEFEALLFSDVESFRHIMVEATSGQINELRQICDKFNTPEDIDDSVWTAPSKRIVSVFPEYRKALHGPLIAETIGVQTIRDRCPRFNGWLKRLSEFGATNCGH